MTSNLWVIDLDATMRKNKDFPVVWDNVVFIGAKFVDGSITLDESLKGFNKVEGTVIGYWSESDSADLIIGNEKTLELIHENLKGQFMQIDDEGLNEFE